MPKPRRGKVQAVPEPPPVESAELADAESAGELPWEQRASDRQGWRVWIRVVIVQGGVGRGWTRNEIRVETCDLSRGGFSFFYPQYVPPGTWIECEVELKGQTVMIVGQVRDCYHVDGVRHRVGVQFSKIQRPRR